MAASESKGAAVPTFWRHACRGGGGSVPKVCGGGLSARPGRQVPRHDTWTSPCPWFRRFAETFLKPPRALGRAPKGLAGRRDFSEPAESLRQVVESFWKAPRVLGRAPKSLASRRDLPETGESPRRVAEGSRERPKGLGKSPKGFGTGLCYFSPNFSLASSIRMASLSRRWRVSSFLASVTQRT